MIVIPSRHFEKKVAKLSKKIKIALAERISLFISEPHHITLNNHQLHGSLRSYRSINVTGDYRLIYEDYDTNTVRLIDIDTHSKLYSG
ncbi:MAG: type II toxin-antitoxin system mRNA interferase toxin, RelE/StbE family [Patescibacteria group bacterium]|nr:type II toxin-antitoxin system mRNA interferase toxin, RelE/StbE family [Patescibacteria group bacterium]